MLDIRSLLPRLTVRTHRKSSLIRDANDKTLLSGWPLTIRLFAQPLRDFDKQARRWLRYVTRELHFPEVDEALFAEAIRLAEIDATAPSLRAAPGAATMSGSSDSLFARATSGSSASILVQKRAAFRALPSIIGASR